MSEFSERVKDQVDQIDSSVDQVVTASRGLYVKLKEESNKQFDELVKVGKEQADAEESFMEQLKKDIKAPFDDVKSSLDQVKTASVGLIVKAVNSGEQLFDELVKLGNSKLEESKAKKKFEVVKDSMEEAQEKVAATVS